MKRFEVNSPGRNYTYVTSFDFFFYGLQLMLIYLKLTNQVDFNWYWTLSPFIFVAGLFVFVLVVATGYQFVKNLRN